LVSDGLVGPLRLGRAGRYDSDSANPPSRKSGSQVRSDGSEDLFLVQTRMWSVLLFGSPRENSEFALPSDCPQVLHRVYVRLTTSPFCQSAPPETADFPLLCQILFFFPFVAAYWPPPPVDRDSYKTWLNSGPSRCQAILPLYYDFARLISKFVVDGAASDH